MPNRNRQHFRWHHSRWKSNLEVCIKWLETIIWLILEEPTSGWLSAAVLNDAIGSIETCYLTLTSHERWCVPKHRHWTAFSNKQHRKQRRSALPAFELHSLVTTGFLSQSTAVEVSPWMSITSYILCGCNTHDGLVKSLIVKGVSGVPENENEPKQFACVLKKSENTDQPCGAWISPDSNGADRSQVGPMLAQWTLLSGSVSHTLHIHEK